MADFSIKSGDDTPSLVDSLTYGNGDPVDLTNATVGLIMRSFSSPAPVALTGTATITAALEGNVAFTFTAADTATAGLYMANWSVVFNDGAKMTFPTTGYLWISVEESLLETGHIRLVGLPDVKDYLNIDHNDRRHDEKILGFIDAVRPQVERITGPILNARFDERFAGGNSVISLTNRPSAGTGCTPYINVVGVVEYRAAMEFPLASVATPVYGSIYSYELDERLGTITRRSAGGSTIPFALGPASVRVIYECGQRVVPENVRTAVKEWARIDLTSTMMVGSGRLTVADTEDASSMAPSPAFGMPRRVAEMLAPIRRGPSLA